MVIEKSLFTYFIEAYTKNYVNFKGRARKREFWGFQLFFSIIFLVLLLLSIFAAGIVVILLLIFSLGSLLPAISMTVRRLHDANMSGVLALYNLIGLIPGVGEVIVIICSLIVGLLPGTKGENEYGQDPLQNKIE